MLAECNSLFNFGLKCYSLFFRQGSKRHVRALSRSLESMSSTLDVLIVCIHFRVILTLYHTLSAVRTGIVEAKWRRDLFAKGWIFQGFILYLRHQDFSNVICCSRFRVDQSGLGGFRIVCKGQGRNYSLGYELHTPGKE